jgi:PAS domain S-box-containing protein
MHVPTGRTTRNDVFNRLTLVPAEELDRGLAAWSDRIHDADREEVLSKRRRLLAREIDSYWVDYRVQRVGGGWSSLRAHVAVTGCDDDGRPVWIGGVLLDVSREKETERRLHAVFDRPFQFIGLLTPEGAVIETNQSSLRRSGRLAVDVVGRPLWEGPLFAQSPELQSRVQAGIATAAAGELVRFEIVNRANDGSPITVDFTLTPLRDLDGTVVNIIPEGRDISELACIRDALREAERRLSTATEAGNIGLWEICYQDRSLWLSDRWWSMLGYDPGEMPPTFETVESLMHPDDRPTVLHAMERHRIGLDPGLDYELRMRCKDGAWRWINSKGRAIERADDGRALRVSGVHIDIHDRKQAQLHLATADRLESVGRLAAGVAHEINTPVQYVNDSVYFIRDGVKELIASVKGQQATGQAVPEAAPDLPYLLEHLPAALDRAIDGLARIAEIVQSMKEFSHADQEAMCPVDLKRAILSTLVVARSEYKYVARLETDLADLPEVICHGSQIGQVVLNLVVNAAHAIADAAQGGGREGLITVRAFVDGDEVVIAVADTGSGIPESIRDRIFDPFFTTKGVGRGTGQGLSLVHNVVVKGHGGSVSFQTETGQGTTFFVRLPVRVGRGAGQVVAA